MFTKEDYVSFETARLLKENGYNEECAYYIIRDEDGYIRHLYASTVSSFTKTDKILYRCPTLYEAQKWLRNQHDLNIEIYFDESQLWGYKIRRCNKDDGLEDILSMFSDYEQALDKGIQDALDLIKMNYGNR